jgi:hypothetical protein
MFPFQLRLNRQKEKTFGEQVQAWRLMQIALRKFGYLGMERMVSFQVLTSLYSHTSHRTILQNILDLHQIAI